jgi:hypothetical protein
VSARSSEARPLACCCCLAPSLLSFLLPVFSCSQFRLCAGETGLVGWAWQQPTPAPRRTQQKRPTQTDRLLPAAAMLSLCMMLQVMLFAQNQTQSWADILVGQCSPRSRQQEQQTPRPRQQPGNRRLTACALVVCDVLCYPGTYPNTGPSAGTAPRRGCCASVAAAAHSFVPFAPSRCLGLLWFAGIDPYSYGAMGIGLSIGLSVVGAAWSVAVPGRPSHALCRC